jgi:hypothetical protein
VGTRLWFAVVLTLSLTFATVGGTTSAGVELQSSAGASRVIDRAYLCTNAVRAGGLREISVWGRTGFQDSGSWKWLAEASIGNNGRTPTLVGPDARGRRVTVYTHWHFGSSAGAGPLADDPTHERFFWIWSKWARACKSSPKRLVPLSGRGLSGGEAGQSGDDYTCPAPRRVLVRARGVFSSPTYHGRPAPDPPPVGLRLDRRTLMLDTDVPLQQVSYAVRTQAGKPLAFVSANDSGKARLFAADSCIPE